MTTQKPGLQIVPALTEDQDIKVAELLRAVSPVLQVNTVRRSLPVCYTRRVWMQSIVHLVAFLVQQPVKLLDLAALLYAASETCPNSIHAFVFLHPIIEGSKCLQQMLQGICTTHACVRCQGLVYSGLALLYDLEQSLYCHSTRNKLPHVSIVPLQTSPPLKVWCTHSTLARYLQARDWNTAQAEKQLRGTLEW